MLRSTIFCVIDRHEFETHEKILMIFKFLALVSCRTTLYCHFKTNPSIVALIIVKKFGKREIATTKKSIVRKTQNELEK